jgi:hypothetical protein
LENNPLLNSAKINKLLLWKWLLIGLFIRLLLMPFTFHGSDIFLNYYSPHVFLAKGAFDPYLYIARHFPLIGTSYYPPVFYYFFYAWLLPLKLFLPRLEALYRFLEPNMLVYSFNTVHYAEFLKDFDLFRTLFVFKIPYLVCDYAIAMIISFLLKDNPRQALTALRAWMLNPFVLHSAYMLGQSDLIPALCVMLAVWAVFKGKNYPAAIMLSLGAGTKGYPLLLLPALIILSAPRLSDKFKLTAVSAGVFFLVAAPFYFSSGFAFLGSFNAYNAFPASRKIFFALPYLAWLFVLYRAGKDAQQDFYFIASSFTVILLLFYLAYTATLRHFIAVSPFLIILALKNRIFWVYNILFIVSLFYLRTAGNTQQWGLFAPLHPQFTSGLPIADSFLSLAVNVKYLHQLAFRVFALTTITMIVHLVYLNRDRLKICLLRK